MKLNSGMIHHQKPTAIDGTIKIFSITISGAKQFENTRKKKGLQYVHSVWLSFDWRMTYRTTKALLFQIQHIQQNKRPTSSEQKLNNNKYPHQLKHEWNSIFMQFDLFSKSKSLIIITSFCFYWIFGEYFITFLFRMSYKAQGQQLYNSNSQNFSIGFTLGIFVTKIGRRRRRCRSCIQRISIFFLFHAIKKIQIVWKFCFEFRCY